MVTPARDFCRFDEDDDSAYFADSAEPGRPWAAAETFEHAPRQGDPLYAVWARRTPGDSASLC